MWKFTLKCLLVSSQHWSSLLFASWSTGDTWKVVRKLKFFTFLFHFSSSRSRSPNVNFIVKRIKCRWNDKGFVCFQVANEGRENLIFHHLRSSADEWEQTREIPSWKMWMKTRSKREKIFRVCVYFPIRWWIIRMMQKVYNEWRMRGKKSWKMFCSLRTWRDVESLFSRSIHENFEGKIGKIFYRKSSPVVKWEEHTKMENFEFHIQKQSKQNTVEWTETSEHWKCKDLHLVRWRLEAFVVASDDILIFFTPSPKANFLHNLFQTFPSPLFFTWVYVVVCSFTCSHWAWFNLKSQKKEPLKNNNEKNLFSCYKNLEPSFFFPLFFLFL